MTYKDLVALLVFTFCMFAIFFLYSYYLDHKSVATIDFIELPESVTINPELN